MADFSTNPLFRAAAKELKDLARREFARSSIGQIAETIRREKTRSQNLARTVQRYGNNPAQVLRKLSGSTPFGSFVRQVERYAKAPDTAVSGAINQFLNQLGPLGSLVKALAGTSGITRKRQSEELALAASLIRAFGGEAWLPRELSTADDWQRGIEAAKQRLEEAGYEVNQREFDLKHPLHEPTGRQNAPGRPRKTVDVPLAKGGTKRFPKGHPIVTGQMVLTPQSSNVYAFGYDLDAAVLYVRFKQDDPDNPSQKKNSPGSLYKYENVEPELFLGMYQATSKGVWIWSNLRVRGTISGYQKAYELVGITAGYVPRRAQMTAGGEAYVPRSIRTDKGNWRSSQRGYELVRPLSGRPSNGRANNGRANNGRT